MSKAFFDKFEGLKGCKFVGIKGYSNKHGEVADLTILTNFNVRNAKEKDLNTLKSLDDKDLRAIQKECDVDLDVIKTALAELIDSGEKNLNEETKTTASKAQEDAYIYLTNSVKMNKDSMDVFIVGQRHTKKVIVEGTYPIVKSRPKTIAKKAIKKHCNLSMERYRSYKVGSLESIQITGDTIQMK